MSGRASPALQETPMVAGWRRRVIVAEGPRLLEIAPEMRVEPLLIGRAARDVPAFLGHVFSLCGAAHRGAAQAALGLKIGLEEPGRIARELLRDHLSALSHMLPGALGLARIGLPVAPGQVARDTPLSSSATDALRAALGRGRDGGIFAPAFSALHALEATARWHHSAFAADDLGATIPDPTFFSRVADDDLLATADFAGPIARRLFARLIEARRLLGALESGDFSAYAPVRLSAEPDAGGIGERIGEGLSQGLNQGLGQGLGEGLGQGFCQGLGEAPAARGRLTHRARLTDGRVTAYGIETPTRAMLTPGGLVPAFLDRAEALGGMTARLLALALIAFDPCMPHQITPLAAGNVPGNAARGGNAHA